MVNLPIVLCFPWNTGRGSVIAQYIGWTKGGVSASTLVVCLGKQILDKERVPREQGKRSRSCEHPHPPRVFSGPSLTSRLAAGRMPGDKKSRVC